MRTTYLISTAILFFALNSSAQKTGKFTDNRDGKKYDIVKIGSTVWMADNLAYEAKKNCWVYNSDKNNLEKYGYLYTWAIANRICPQGWKLPSVKDVEELYKNIRIDESKRYKVFMPGGSSGFKAVLGGKTANNSLISTNKDKIGMFWLFDKHNDSGEMKVFQIDGVKLEVSIDKQNKNEGLSVRCIKE